jgi:hypothetical protein
MVEPFADAPLVTMKFVQAFAVCLCRPDRAKKIKINITDFFISNSFCKNHIPVIGSELTGKHFHIHADSAGAEGKVEQGDVLEIHVRMFLIQIMHQTGNAKVSGRTKFQNRIRFSC